MSRPSAAALLKQRQRPPRNGEKEGGGREALICGTWPPIGDRGASASAAASFVTPPGFTDRHGLQTHPDFAHPASSGGKLKKTGKSRKSSCWLETQVFPSSLGSRCDLVLDFGGALKLCGDHLANGPKS